MTTPTLPGLSVEVALGATHLDDPTTLTYTDLSDRALSWSWKAGRADQTGKFSTGSITIVLDNEDRELDPLNSHGLVPAMGRSVADGVTTNTDATVTSASALFRAEDVGKAISGAGIPDGATIATYTSATSVELSAPATATATGVALTIAGGRGLPLCPARIRFTYKGDTYDVIARGFLGPEGWPVARSPHGTDSTVTLTVFDPTAAMAWVDMAPSPWLALISGLEPDWWVPGEVVDRLDTANGFELPNRSGSGGAAVTESAGVRTVTDAVTAVDFSLTSATADFRFDDVGRPVVGDGIPDPTLISEVIDATEVVLSNATTDAASGVTVTIGTTVTQPVGPTNALSLIDREVDQYLGSTPTDTFIAYGSIAMAVKPLVKIRSSEADVFPDGDLAADTISVMWKAASYDNGSLAGIGQAEIFTVTSGSDRRLRCWIDGDDGGALKLTVYDGAGAELTTMVADPPTTDGASSYGDNYDDNAAHGITVRRIGGTSVDLFVDGVQVTELVDVPASAFAGDVVLGEVPVGSFPTAAFDELLVFHRALTDLDCVRLSAAPVVNGKWGRGDTPEARLALFYEAAQWLTLADEYDEVHPPPASIVSPDPAVTLVGVEEAATWPSTLGSALVAVADAIAGDVYALRDGRVRVRSLLALDDPALAAVYATPTAHFTDEPSPDPSPVPLRRGPLGLTGTRLDRVVNSVVVEVLAISNGAWDTQGTPTAAKIRGVRPSRFGRREQSWRLGTESKLVADALIEAVLDRYASPPVEIEAVSLYPHIDGEDDGALMDWLVQTMELESPVTVTDTPPAGDPIVFDLLNVQGWTWNAGPGVAMSVSLNLAKS